MATSPKALLRFFILACAAFLACQAGNGVSTKAVRSVPICPGVTLSANYLALAGPDQGPGFRFVLVNRTGREIRLAQPVPSSSHWYARSHGRWLWRASNGAGGSLLDAGNEHGRVVVYAPPVGTETELLTLPPHQSREWTESQRENPVDVLLSRGARVPGGLRLCLSCRRRPAGRDSLLWFAVGTRSHAAKIVSLSLVVFGSSATKRRSVGSYQ
jgi:hypothetical protein